MSKRINHLHEQICSRENIELADEKARKGKTNRYGVKKHDEHRKEDNLAIQRMLSNLSYVTSEYDTFKIYEPKERLIFRLPYYPDRIIHHAIMNIMEPIWTSIFIKNTYSCIKNRGIHKLVKDLKHDLEKYPDETVYCLKFDITRFYPSIDHDILKQILRKKIKDKHLLTLLDNIIDSADGVPIGNYLSQFFANLYLAYFDHWVKEECRSKFYYRYADDIVILSNNKQYLRNLFCAMRIYLSSLLKLKIKDNYQIFPVDARGINFVGYVFRHDYILLRKSIKVNMLKLIHLYEANKINFDKFFHSMSSYKGWLKYCNARHLANVIQNRTNFRISNWNGKQMNISKLYGRTMFVMEIIEHNKYYEIHCIFRGVPRTVKSKNYNLLQSLYKRGMQNTFKITIKYGSY